MEVHTLGLFQNTYHCKIVEIYFRDDNTFSIILDKKKLINKFVDRVSVSKDTYYVMYNYSNKPHFRLFWRAKPNKAPTYIERNNKMFFFSIKDK